MSSRSILPENITLILGAGVSKPYGFPLGSELAQKIIAVDPSSIEAETGSVFPARLVKEFQIDLRNSGRRSIDRFLQDRPEYSDLGKTLIAFTLMKLEQPDALYAGESHGGIYSYLYNNILDPRSPDKLNAKRFVVITYNYDRSLEFFLWNALRHGFKLNHEEARLHLATLPIYHVHGSFGDICGRHKRDYASNLCGLEYAPKRLRIVSEDIERSDVIHECRTQISMSRMIALLGFGYDRVNVERLRVPEIMQEREQNKDGRASSILGTMKGFTQQEVETNVRPLFKPLKVALHPLDCLAFLRELAHFWG